MLKVAIVALLVFTGVGGYIFYNTNILNGYWSNEEQDSYRANYEKLLKENEYLPQPKIIAINLALDLFPSERSYVAEGHFILQNKDKHALKEIHVQQRMDAHIELEYLKFAGGATVNKEYEPYGYYIYTLNQALEPGDSIRMDVKQTYKTHGFREKHSDTEVIYNGNFFTNDDFPSFGYNNNYELRTDNERAEYGLSPRVNRPQIDDPRELRNARTGDDGYEINFEMTISTDAKQTAVVPGKLEKCWTDLALRRFIRDWNVFGERIHPERYASTKDLLPYFRELTPDSLQYIIKDLFETITLYENKVVEGTYIKLAGNQYQLSLSIEARKFRVDSLRVEKEIELKDWIDIGIYGEGGGLALFAETQDYGFLDEYRNNP